MGPGNVRVLLLIVRCPPPASMQVESLGGQLAAAGAREEQREADLARLEEEVQKVGRG